MMTLAAAAVVAAMVSQSELKLVADTSWPAVPGKMRQPTLNSSEIAAAQYREKLPHSRQSGARQFCYLSPASRGSTCVVNSMPAFPLP